MKLLAPLSACLLGAALLAAASVAGAIEFRELSASPSPDGAPGFSPDGTRVSFSSSRSGNWEIYLIDEAGGEPENFTNHPDTDIYANWLPSGEGVSFTSDRDNGDGGGDMDIWMRDLEGGDPVCLTTWSGYDNFAAFSPEGGRVAFTSDRGSEGRKSIWLLELDQQRFTQLSFGLEDCYHSNWSPDGAWIVFDGRDPATPTQVHLYRVPAAGGEVEELPVGMQMAVDPAWSPSGRYIAFGGGDDLFDWDLWLWDLQTSALIRLCETRPTEQSPYWNSTGTEMVLARVNNENKDVWIATDLGIVPAGGMSWSRLKGRFGR